MSTGCSFRGLSLDFQVHVWSTELYVRKTSIYIKENNKFENYTKQDMTCITGVRIISTCLCLLFYLLFKTYLFFICVYVCNPEWEDEHPMYTGAQEGQFRVLDLWELDPTSQLWTALCVLENDPESSVRVVASFLNHGTISLGPFCSFSFWDSISGIQEWSWICYIPPAGLKLLNLLSLPPEYCNCLCFFLIRKIILSIRKIIMTFSYWSRQKNISPPFYGSACES